MTRCCETCAMFYPCKTLNEWESWAEPYEGECRRYPPTTHGDDVFGKYPMVSTEDWCGEFSEGSYEERGFR